VELDSHANEWATPIWIGPVTREIPRPMSSAKRARFIINRPSGARQGKSTGLQTKVTANPKMGARS
jgi:hypothetical protein